MFSAQILKFIISPHYLFDLGSYKFQSKNVVFAINWLIKIKSFFITKSNENVMSNINVKKELETILKEGFLEK